MSLQEVWNVPPNVYFTANGYHPLVYNTRDPKGLSPNIGGVGLIIRETYEFEVINNISFFIPHVFRAFLPKYTSTIRIISYWDLYIDLILDP